MFSKSVISRSGQLWKLLIAIIALLVGSFVPLFAEEIVSWTAGTVIAIGGYAFGLLTIRCSSCNKMWFWEAALDARLYKPLFKDAHCPCCEHRYGE
jgi:hypothetical protein